MAQAADALAHLTEISTQIQAAVIFDREGTVLGSIVDDERAGRIAEKALELFRAAEKQGNQELVQLDASLPPGTVWGAGDAAGLSGATPGPEPTVGLVFYDLKTCLRGFGEEPPKPKPKSKPKPRRAPAKRTTTPRKKNDAAS